MPAAARVNDTTTHGGRISKGSATVEIGFKAAARLGDPQICPVTDSAGTHFGGPIATASHTVFIEGQQAARVGDTCLCTRKGITTETSIGHFVDLDGDGIPDRWEYEDSANTWKFPENAEDNGSSLQNQLFHIKATAGQGPDGWGFGANGEFNIDKASGQVVLGDEDGPVTYTTGSEGSVDTVSGSVSVLPGYDGRNIGIGVNVSGSASVLNAKAKRKLKVSVLGIDLSGAASVDGGIADASFSQGIWVMYDTKAGAFRFGGAGEGFDFEVVIGNSDPAEVRAPAVINSGEATVEIG